MAIRRQNSNLKAASQLTLDLVELLHQIPVLLLLPLLGVLQHDRIEARPAVLVHEVYGALRGFLENGLLLGLHVLACLVVDGRVSDDSRLVEQLVQLAGVVTPYHVLYGRLVRCS